MLCVCAFFVLVLGTVGDWWNMLAFVVLGTFGLTLLWLPHAALRALVKKLLPAGPEMWAYTVTPQAITEHTPQYTTSWAWSSVLKVVATPDRWVVVMRPGSAVALPKAAFDPAAAAAIEELLRTRISAGNGPS